MKRSSGESTVLGLHGSSLSVVWLPVLKDIVNAMLERQEELYTQITQASGVIQLSSVRVRIDLEYGNAPYVHNKVFFEDSCKSYVNCLALLNDWPICIHRIRHIYATFPDVFIEVKARPFAWFCHQPTNVEKDFAEHLMYLLNVFEKYKAHTALVLCEQNQIQFYDTAGFCVREITFIGKGRSYVEKESYR